MSGLQREWINSTTGKAEAEAGEIIAGWNTAVIRSGENRLIH